MNVQREISVHELNINIVPQMEKYSLTFIIRSKSKFQTNLWKNTSSTSFDNE